MTDNQVPDPDDPAFFAKYTMPQGIRDFAFGPSGGTPPPGWSAPAVLNPPPAPTTASRQISRDPSRGRPIQDEPAAPTPRRRSRTAR